MPEKKLPAIVNNAVWETDVKQRNKERERLALRNKANKEKHLRDIRGD